MSDASLPPELIEKFRQTGIRLDRQGRFWHEGEEISHKRFRVALLRWLDLREDGRPILRLDDKRYAYVDVEDAMLLVLSIRWDGDRAFIKTNDEVEEELCYATLEQAADNTLYCRARASQLLARVTTRAYYQLAERIEEEARGGFVLLAAGQRFPIAERE